jgi:hypothetical protein
MLRIDRKHIPENKREVRLFMVGVDASELIPHLFSHYFNIGIGRIFYIDNDSSDNSLEVLDRYENVHVWLQKEGFSGIGTKAKSGAAWIESLMVRYGVGNWCLLADTDELFVYPDYRTKPIEEFVSGLDGDCVVADFIDMYSDKKVKETHIKNSLMETCPYTDKDGGSCRVRVLNFTPCREKMPLFLCSSSISIDAGFHKISGYNKPSTVKCAVLHFKFLSGLPKRLKTHGHKMSGSDIKAVAYNRIGEINFYDPEVSVKFNEWGE